MIEFHAGAGPASQAVGIALEEGFFDYRVVPGGAAPAIVDQGERIEGVAAILAHVAQRAGWPAQADAAQWLAWTNDGGLAQLDQRLAASPFILGDISIADMAVWPRLVHEHATLATHPNIARWADRMGRRSAVGRGLSAISADRAAAGR